MTMKSDQSLLLLLYFEPLKYINYFSVTGLGACKWNAQVFANKIDAIHIEASFFYSGDVIGGLFDSLKASSSRFIPGEEMDPSMQRKGFYDSRDGRLDN